MEREKATLAEDSASLLQEQLSHESAKRHAAESEAGTLSQHVAEAEAEAVRWRAEAEAHAAEARAAREEAATRIAMLQVRCMVPCMRVLRVYCVCTACV